MGVGRGGVAEVLSLFFSESSGVIVKDMIAFSISCLLIYLFIFLLCFSFFNILHSYLDFPGGSDSKESAGSAGEMGSIPVSEISPGEGNGNPLQYSCLENFMNRGG